MNFIYFRPKAMNIILHIKANAIFHYYDENDSAALIVLNGISTPN